MATSTMGVNNNCNGVTQDVSRRKIAMGAGDSSAVVASACRPGTRIGCPCRVDNCPHFYRTTQC